MVMPRMFEGELPDLDAGLLRGVEPGCERGDDSLVEHA